MRLSKGEKDENQVGSMEKRATRTTVLNCTPMPVGKN